MRKYLLLLISAFTIAQTAPSRLPGLIITANQPTVTSTPSLTTTEANGLQGKISPVNLPLSNATATALETYTENSSGALSGFLLTDNGNGTVNISSGVALLRSIDQETGLLSKYTIPAVTNLALTDNANNFVLANYNGGSPSLTVTTDPAVINTTTNTLVWLIARVGNKIDRVYVGGQNVDSNGKLRRRFLNSEPIFRAQGAALSFTNRTISVSGGLFYLGLTPYSTSTLGASFTNVYNNASVWTRQTAQTLVNNTQYNVNGVLTTMNNGRFRVDYVYLLVNSPSQVYTVMGSSQYNNIAEARLATLPNTLPVELQRLGVLVGRLIIQKDATEIAEVSSAYDVRFNASTVINHNDTGAIQGGAVGDYQHVTTAEKTTWNGKQSKIFVTPEDFGAIGDGISDDRASIQNAINSGIPVFLNAKTYLVNGTLNILSSTYITGSGEKSILKTNSNSPAISVQSDKNYFKNFKILGNGRGTLVNYTTTRPLQNGIEVNGAHYNNIIEDVIFDNLGNAGIYGINNQNGVSTDVTSSINVKSCFFFNSLYGINFDTLFEYNLVYNSIFKDNETGIVIKGGNNPIIGGHIVNNRTGVSVLSGSNDSHSTLSSVTINHSIEKAIYIGDIINGFTIDNCIIFFNGIELIGSKDVIINGGLFKLNNPLVITNTNGTVVQNVKFVSTSVSTSFSGNTGLRFFNNSYTDGTVRPAAMVDNITNITNTDIFDINATVSSKNLLRMRVNSGNRYLIGSDSGIAGGNDGDLNTYVYGNNSMFFSTNAVKRFTISGSGVASFSLPVVVPNAVNANEAVNKGQLDATATSGGYTPTLTASSNITALTFNSAFYTKVGSVVTARITVTFSTTSGNTVSSFNFTLPVNKTTSTSISLGNGNSITGASISNSVDVVSTSSVNTATASFISGAGSGANGKATIFIMYDITQ